MNTKSIITFIFFAFVIGCKSNEYRCGLHPDAFPDNGVDSKIVRLNQTKIMDTITVILEGKIFDDKDVLPGGNIILSNKNNSYHAFSDINGKFKFLHIKSGTYQIGATYVGFRKLVSDSISLKTGSVHEIEIKMGAMGKDDIEAAHNTR